MDFLEENKQQKDDKKRGSLENQQNQESSEQLDQPRTSPSLQEINQQKETKEVKEDTKLHPSSQNWFKSPQLNQKSIQELSSTTDQFTLQGDGKKKAFLLGISGGSSAGKSILAQLLKTKVKELQSSLNLSIDSMIPIIKQSDFYHNIPDTPKGVDPEKFRQKYLQNNNFDIPEAIDWDYLIRCVQFLKDRNPVNIPQYNMNDERREKETKNITQKADIIIVEGTLIFNNETLRDMFDLKIFLDTDEDTRLSRRVFKDCCIRKKSIKDVIEKYRKFTKGSFEKYTFPAKKYADIVIPNYGGDYSQTSLEDENFAGFSTLDSGVIDVILNLLNHKILLVNKANNSPDSSPQIVAESDIIKPQYLSLYRQALSNKQ